MAMISKFHKIIQSKLVWLGILVIIVFMFVIWGVQVPSQNQRAEELSRAAMFKDKPITYDELRHARANIYLSYSMMMGQAPRIDKELDEQMTEEAYARIAALRLADELGIKSTEDDIVKSIQQDPLFQQEGRFNRQIYDMFIERFVNQLGFTEPMFEQHVREENTLRKLNRIIYNSILVTPLELNRVFHALTDTFVVKYAALSTKDIDKKIIINDEEAKAFFEDDPERFMIPEKVKVKYVAFDVSNFKNDITITEEETLDYYNSNIEDYTEILTQDAEETDTNIVETAEHDEAINDDTNVVETVETEINESRDTNVIETAGIDEFDSLEEEEESFIIPYEDVKTNIIEKLTQMAALNNAADRATDFVVDLTPDRDGHAPTFEELSKKYGVTIKTLKPFTRSQLLPDIDAGRAFNRAAFELEDLPESYYSDAIPGEEYVYVIALEESIPERIPTYEEVKMRVKAAARLNALNEALTEKAEDVRSAVQTGLKEGKSFEEAMAPFNIDVVSSEEFTITDGWEDDYASDIIPEILSYSANELLELITSGKEIIIAYIDQREPGDQSSFNIMKPELIQASRRQRGQLVLGDWRDYIMEKGNFEVRDIAVEEDASPVDEEDDTDI